MALVMLAAACASDGTARVDTAAGNTWAREHLTGELGPDYVVQLAAAGNDLLVAGADDRGFLHSFVASGSGAFEAGTPVDLSLGYPGIGAVARLGDRWIAIGGTTSDDGSTFALQVLESRDGLEWTTVDASGLEDPGELHGLTQVDGGLVAGGTLRVGDDPSIGPFRPAAWTTADGSSWTQVGLPMGGASEGSVAGIATIDARVLAVGNLDDRGAVWSSRDRGITWTLAGAAVMSEVSSIGGIAVADGIVALSAWASTPELGEEGELGQGLILRSTDGGSSWSVASDPPPSARAGYPVPIFAGGESFFVVDDDRSDWYDEKVCYADIDLCRAGPTSAKPSLYASTDGDRWTRVDTRDVEGGPEFEAIGVAADGRVVGLKATAGGTDAWIWPAGVPLAMREADAEPPPPEADVDLIKWNDPVEQGHRYALPVPLHCGMDWLGLDGRTWHIVDSTRPGDGGYPDSWPIAGETLYGFVTLVDANTVEYSIGDGEVIATYEPATTDPPGCA
ncbi:MAG: WD40/YVTN/BNR-like repeat-containing protein [Microthrixaceae bacterium]